MATASRLKSFDWTGASGVKYTYYIYGNPTRFNPNQHGNYIYARRNIDGRWMPIYIGEGSLSERCSGRDAKAGCILSHGATHIHAHLETLEDARKAEELDLLANHTQAYWPTGCNGKFRG